MSETGSRIDVEEGGLMVDVEEKSPPSYEESVGHRVQGPPVNPMLNVKVTPLMEHYDNGAPSSTPVLFEIETAAGKLGNQRPSFELCLVLDRSGSMAGEKLDMAKRAITEIIQNLRKGDILHCVVYGSVVRTVFRDVQGGGDCKFRDSLIEEVNQLRCEGCTNLSGGLERGVKLITGCKYPRQVGSLRRMFVFSDGIANVGITDVSGVVNLVRTIKARDISVDSFGIGVDFEADMMKNIAEVGGGVFYFIDTPGVISTMVSKAVQEMIGVVGVDAVLKLECDNGTLVRKHYGGLVSEPSTDKRCVIGDLNEDNVRSVLIELGHTPGETGEAVRLRWELAYTAKSSQGDNAEVLRGELALNAVRVEPNSAVCDTRNVAVQNYITIQEASDSDMHIATLLRSGSIDEAKRVQDLQIEMLRGAEGVMQSSLLDGVLEMAIKTRKKLEISGGSKEVQQRVEHGAYLKRSGSKRYIDAYVENKKPPSVGPSEPIGSPSKLMRLASTPVSRLSPKHRKRQRVCTD
jgi:Ca-activated chloride channel family protein